MSQLDLAVAQRCERASRLLKEGYELEAVGEFALCLQETRQPLLRAGIFNEIGQVYSNSGKMDDAREMFEMAHKLYPESADAMANIGLIHKWMSGGANPEQAAAHLRDAEKWLTRALDRNPWHNAAQFTQAITALLAGDYRRGFELYECRFRSRTAGLKKLETAWPEWDGLNGSNVYIYGEQGAGDIFLMMRYARLIRERGLRQSWVVQAPMATIARTIPEIDLVVDIGDPVPEFDCHIPCFSLPRIFGTTIETIPTAPYIPKPEFGILPGDGLGFNVGIAWRGSNVQLNDKIRSTDLRLWQPLFDLCDEFPQLHFHCLQVDGWEAALVHPNVAIYPNPPKDWMDTARRLVGLDLVISVDTGLVHLAGAMGFECWCAMHCRPYFVYPPIREDCPWYPSVRLFKQRKEFEWEPVFERIAGELRKKLTP